MVACNHKDYDNKHYDITNIVIMCSYKNTHYTANYIFCAQKLKHNNKHSSNIWYHFHQLW